MEQVGLFGAVTNKEPLLLKPESVMQNTRCQIKTRLLGFAGGAVVKDPPANAADAGLSPGPGRRSHMPQSN